MPDAFVHLSRVRLINVQEAVKPSLCHLFHPGEQLQINQPSVYDCDVPPSLATLVPTLAAVCKEKTTDGRVSAQMLTMSNRSVTLTSAGGTDFISFAKGASFCNGRAAVSGSHEHTFYQPSGYSIQQIR